MNGGAGPALGLLTFLGYLLLAVGSLQVWRNRVDFYILVQDEISVLRRSFSRYTPAGPFYSLREDSRIKAIPTSFIRSLSRLQRSRVNGGAVLLMVGMILFLLDFFL
jgi:hypothetical protein